MYNQAQAVPVEVPHIPNNISRLRNVYNELTSIRERLVNATGRLSGQGLKGVGGKAGKEESMGGYVGELAELVASCETEAREIASELVKLEKAI